MSRIRSTNPIGVGAEPTRRHHAGVKAFNRPGRGARLRISYPI